MFTNAYRVFIFDWDGTLINSHAKIIASLGDAFIACDLPVPDQLGRIIGLSIEHSMRELYPEGDEATIQALAAAYRRAYVERDRVPCTLFHGVEEMLKSLHQKGVQLAIATGKSRVGLDRALERTSVAPLLAITRCADETASKPNPLMLHEIARELGCTINDCVMVGDSIYDMQMAENAGMDRIAVMSGEYEASCLLPYAPKQILACSSELIHFF
jgi:phosphoglycolate phosphatase